jgi:dTDP-4-dehydrorhamnose reductase
MKKQGKNKKIETLVFGAGQIAGFIEEYFGKVLISAADITKVNEIEKDIKKYKPNAVINTAAMTSLEWCEQNKLKAFEINTLGALNVWEVCKKYNVFMCHFSSGCIFSSETVDQVYYEDSIPNPKSYYSWTKVWSENLLGKSPKLLILRPRVVISSKVERRNTLAKWMVYSHFISDQNSVTIVEDMLPVMKSLIARRISGTFHIANKGTISPLEIARILKKTVNPKMIIKETTLEEVNKNLISKRVSTVLNTQKLETVGFGLPNVDTSVLKIIKKFGENLEKMGGLKVLDDIRQEAKEKFTIVQKKATTFTPVN